MKYHIFSVKDRCAALYGSPYYAVSKGSAIRGFMDEINRADEQNQLYKHPDDFEMCYLGTFDDETATHELLSTPELLCSGTAAKLK
jgi:hypothetical protein